MCLICVEFKKGTLTRNEAENALLELIRAEQISTEHMFEVADIVDGDLA